MRKFSKILFAFLAVMLLSLSFSVHAFAAVEKTGTTTITVVVPEPAEPTPTVTVEPTPTVTVEPTPTGYDNPTPTVTVEPTPTVTVEPTPTATVEPTPTATVEPTPTATVEPAPTERPTEKPTARPTAEPVNPGHDFRFTFTKSWEGDHEDSIDWVLYNPDGTVAHKKFNKKIVSENEWRYEAWFSTDTDYYIVETVPAGYKAVYENVGAHAGETDRCYNGGKIINYKLPKTGDPADLRLWTGMALMGLGVACGAVMIGRRKKAQR